MGIQIEFNPELALRSYQCVYEGTRAIEECIPHNLAVGQTHPFLKRGQRMYFLLGEVPLRETEGDQKLSRPLASVRIL